MPSVADIPDGVGAVADIRRAIDDAGGVLRFDDYVTRALYGPHGFYTGDGRAGRRGDFLTSPEVGPLFGTVIASWIEAEFVRLGRPAEFEVVEFGAGPGTLARSILAQWRSSGVAGHPYTTVEPSAVQRAAHPDGVTAVADLAHLGGRPITGVMIANELLDNLPFRLLVWDGSWREAFVTAPPGEPHRLQEVLLPLDPLAERPDWLPSVAPHGARVPWQQIAHDWVRDTTSSLARGRLLCFDYVTARTSELSAMPWRDWLRTYRAHERGGHYLNAVGDQDITVQVALDQLPEPEVVRTQAQFLQRWGISTLVDEGRSAWEVAAAAPTVAAMKMRSRIRESEALLDVGGLGGFLALEWSR